MFFDQPCCISIKEVDFDLKGFETDAAGICSVDAGHLIIYYVVLGIDKEL